MAACYRIGSVEVLPGASIFPPLSKTSGTPPRNKHAGGSTNVYGYGSARGNVKGPSNGYLHGLSNGAANGHSGGSANGLAKCMADSDDEEEFYGAEERSCCSDSEFQDATDLADFSSDSENSCASQTRVPGSYRSLLIRLQEEQSKRAVLEAALQRERRKVKQLKQDAKFELKSKAGGDISEHATECSAQNTSAQARLAEASPSEFEKEIVVARMVAGAFGRAAGKAEAIAELEAVVERKDKELSRLRDKLTYWETMNHEMSQQNTHAIELLRKRRRMWKSIYRYTFTAGAIGLGIGLLAALNLASSSRQLKASQQSDTMKLAE